MKWPFRILLILNIAYCCLATASDTLPAWMMFRKVEAIDFSLTDVDGNAIDVRKYLPDNAYFTAPRSLLPVLRFICQKGQYSLPLKFDEKIRDVHLEIGPDNCKVPDDI